MGNAAKTFILILICICGAGCASTPYPAGDEASAGNLVAPQAERSYSLQRKAHGFWPGGHRVCTFGL